MPRPALYLIGGLPEQGKTTLGKYFERLLQYPVLSTDDLYYHWVRVHRPFELEQACIALQPHFLRMPDEAKAAWSRFFYEVVLEQIRTNPVTVVEGWLLLVAPWAQQHEIDAVADVLRIRMHKFAVHVSELAEKCVLRPKGRDYTTVLHRLVDIMQEKQTKTPSSAELGVLLSQPIHVALVPEHQSFYPLV